MLLYKKLTYNANYLLTKSPLKSDAYPFQTQYENERFSVFTL